MLAHFARLLLLFVSVFFSFYQMKIKKTNWCALNINVPQMMMMMMFRCIWRNSTHTLFECSHKLNLHFSTNTKIRTRKMLFLRSCCCSCSISISLCIECKTHINIVRTQSTLHEQSIQQHSFSVVLYTINGILCDMHIFLALYRKNTFGIAWNGDYRTYTTSGE